MTQSSQAARLSLHHQVRRPAGDGPHPTVIALHGRGSDEADLLGLAPYLDERLLWISPRAPLPLEGGFEWYRLPSIGVPDPTTFAAALEALDRFLTEAVQTYPVDPRHLYLLGFSQGGMMAYAFTLSQPARVAGVMAHSSYIPLAALQAVRAVDEAGMRGKPFIVLHGRHDPMIPLAWAQQARDTLTRLGADLAYYEFPMAHNVSDRSLAALDAWLDKQLEKAGNHA
jgi:phospholipase/carboxylesterase